MSTLAAPSTDAVTATLDDLTDSLQTDPSLDNDFYRAWMGGPLDPAKVRIFAEQYMARSVNTSVMVALSVVYTQDLKAVRCYRSSYDSLDEFHEWCEYFYLHIGEAEKEHKAEALISAAAVCQSDEDLAAVTSAFRTFAQITADYWNGIYAEMNRV